MKLHVSNCIVFLIALAGGAVHAADYVKVSGTNVDFYYDADFWTLGATATGNTISVRPGDVYQRVDVTEGAADPYQGPVFTASLDFTRAFPSSLIAVAHDGYRLTNEIGFAGAAINQSNGSSGYGAYDLQATYTGGTFDGGAFAGSEVIGTSVEWAYFYYELFTSGGDAGTIPLQAGTASTAHSAISVDGVFHGAASVTGLGMAAAGLDSVTYSFGVSAVPEPESCLMLCAGLALIGLVARRRNRTVPVVRCS